MARDMSASMQAEVIKSTIRSVWIVRLDILGDPVYAWTGRGLFQPSGTGDAALDGNTYIGLGPIQAINDIEDTEAGSQRVTLQLPGIDLNDDLLQQIVVNSNKWQFRQAWIWYGLLNETYNVIANPARIKTGRMDQMQVSHSGITGTVLVTVESHQSYASQALGSRYIQQKDIDSTDKSQDFVHDLANKQPGIGIVNARPGSFGGFGGSVFKDPIDPRTIRQY